MKSKLIKEFLRYKHEFKISEELSEVVLKFIELIPEWINLPCYMNPYDIENNDKVEFFWPINFKTSSLSSYADISFEKDCISFFKASFKDNEYQNGSEVFIDNMILENFTDSFWTENLFDFQFNAYSPYLPKL